MGVRMVIALLLMTASGATVFAEKEDATPIRLYMPDGQRRGDLVEVYVTRHVGVNMEPRLRVMTSGQPQASRPDEMSDEYNDTCIWRPPVEIVTRVGWTRPGGDVPRSSHGTLLLFDLSTFKAGSWKPGVGVRPVLTWKEPDNLRNEMVRMKATSDPVYLGNGPAAFWWTCFGFLVLVIILWLVAGVTKLEWNPLRAWAQYVQTTDGRMSLALSQMALWTLAVGSVVLHFGLIRLKVPDIPWTLIVLMGFSAGTSLMGHWQVKRDQVTNPKPAKPRGLRDLVNILTFEGMAFPSMAKGQMMLWTVVAIFLFMFKSIQEGVLWEVSPELVTLMGVSQGTFLVQKEIGLGKKSERKKAAEEAERKRAELKKIEEAEESGNMNTR